MSLRMLDALAAFDWEWSETKLHDEGARRWQCAELDLTAAETLNMRMRRTVHLTGTYRSANGREVEAIDHDLPIRVGSHAQAAALIARALRRCAPTHQPAWLLIGRDLDAMLPWRASLKEQGP